MLIELERLESSAIEKFAREEVLAVCVRNFVDGDVADRLTQQIMGHGFQKYLNAPGIGRIGMAFYEVENQPPRMADYFESVFDNIDELIKRCTPYVSPVDLLRCVLGEATLEVCPKAGDLVLFNSRRMHAVIPGSDDIGLGLSCFVGYRGPATPLSFWS